MKPLKKSTGILAVVILIVMISGLIYTWEIGYKDKDGQERSILLSNSRP